MPSMSADIEGGCAVASFIAAADTNAAVIKAEKGQVYGVQATGLTAGVKYLKLYDQVALPDETATPKLRIAIPGLTTGAVTNVIFPQGVEFANGIGRRCVGAIADNSTTALSASDVLVNILYR